MRIGILFSSGKDSTNVLWYYLEQGWNVACLLSLLPKNPDSFMFQNPSRELLELQAESLTIPIMFQETHGEKEDELEDLRMLLKEGIDKHNLEGVAVGALASDYQQERITRICHELNIKSFTPLWHKNQEMLLQEMVDAGFDIRMTRIAAEGLSEEWLGKKLMRDDVERLADLHEQTGFHTAGEGGEFETIVLDGPIFTNRIGIRFEKDMESGNRGELNIIETCFIRKN